MTPPLRLRLPLRLLRLTDLTMKKASSIALLRKCLKERGYALIHIDQSSVRNGIQDGLDEAGTLDGFRFPPIMGGVSSDKFVYNDAKRRSFCSLFEIGVAAFGALTHGTSLPKSLSDAVQQRQHQQQQQQQQNESSSTDSPTRVGRLFGTNFDGNEPFSQPSLDPFGYSFFNLFSYDNGMLNSHVDRGLLTVIAAHVPNYINKNPEVEGHEQLAALWVKGPASPMNDKATSTCAARTGGERWWNMDKQLQQHQQQHQSSSCNVIVLLGEDSESLAFAKRYNLRAAEHAVRVDPYGDFVSRSHYRPDPATTIATTTTRNRLSAALILRHNFDKTM